MARFPDTFIQQVAEATDIVELIGQYVALKKKGKDFAGLCPFHDDHSPSMAVSPTKQIYKCFSCGAGGGVFQFVMAYDRVEFPEAVRSLAQRANIPVPTDEDEGPADRSLSKAKLSEVCLFAARFYRQQLQSPAGKDALAYARGRKLTDESIAKFGLGYAPESWDALYSAAHKAGYTDSQLIAAGMAVARDRSSGCYDRFRNRLIFPILDVGGKVIAFGGRALSADEPAKYLNSSETPLFDKSASLYGLNWARQAIVAENRAIVVEGYLDALMCMQSGVEAVVATLGTALTDRQVRLLGRYAGAVVLVFDADAAGQSASERAIDIFLAQQVNVRVAAVPDGKDPCDYCLAHGGDAMRKVVDEAPDAIRYVWSKRQAAYAAARATGDLAGQRHIAEQFLQLVVNSASYGAIDAVRRGQLAQHVAQLLNISSAELEATMHRLARRRPRQSGAATATATTSNGLSDNQGHFAERAVLEVILNREDLFATAHERVDPSDFQTPALRELAQAAWQIGKAGHLTLEHMLADSATSQHGALLAELVTQGLDRGNFEATLSGALAHLEYRRKQMEIQQLKAGGYDADILRQIGEHHRTADPRRRPRIK